MNKINSLQIFLFVSVLAILLISITFELVKEMPMPGFKANRQIGDPIAQSTWYVAGSGGCFRDGTVYHLDGNTLYTRAFFTQFKISDGVRIAQAGDGVAISQNPVRGKRYTTYFQDVGHELRPIRSEIGGKVVKYNSGSSLYRDAVWKNCDVPEIVGHLRSPWNRPYIPARHETVVPETQTKK